MYLSLIATSLSRGAMSPVLAYTPSTTISRRLRGRLRSGNRHRLVYTMSDVQRALDASHSLTGTRSSCCEFGLLSGQHTLSQQRLVCLHHMSPFRWNTHNSLCYWRALARLKQARQAHLTRCNTSRTSCIATHHNMKQPRNNVLGTAEGAGMTEPNSPSHDIYKTISKS